MKPAYLSQAGFKHVVYKDFIFKKSLQRISSVYPAKNEEIMALLHIKNFSCHVTLATFKKKTSRCGSHPDCSVGQWVKSVNRCDPISTLVCVCVCVCEHACTHSNK